MHLQDQFVENIWQVMSCVESCVWTRPEAFVAAWWSRTSMAIYWRGDQCCYLIKWLYPKNRQSIHILLHWLVRYNLVYKGNCSPIFNTSTEGISWSSFLQPVTMPVTEVINSAAINLQRAWGYRPSCIALLPLDQYKIILLGDKGVCVNNLPRIVTWKWNGGSYRRSVALSYTLPPHRSSSVF